MEMDGPSKKIAVVLTHGIGEQIPMETIDNFVRAAWVIDNKVQWTPPPDENGSDIWFKPDQVTGSRELRRITTRWTKSNVNQADKGPRVDFFEFYWADLGQGSTVGQVWDWLRTLLMRWPSTVPEGLMSAWLLLWAAAVTVGLLSLFAVLPWPGGWWHLGLAAAAAVVGYLMQYVVAPYAGEIARYVRAKPRNIAMRAAIRDRGLRLLKDLHDKGAYERIILVGHSLGSIIAYDLISLLWVEHEQALRMQENEPIFQRLRAVETAAHALAGATAADIEDRRCDYREAQRALRLSLRSGGASGTGPKRTADREWLISDFVTFGSPLTHAQFLLARNPADLQNRIDRWLFPTDCPQFERIDSEQMVKIKDRPTPVPPDVLGPDGGLFSYFFGTPKTWSIHDAAPFSAVRWTNIYDSHRYIFWGDIVSGPLAPVFGSGIRDINLKDLRGQARVFTHTFYWSLPEDCDVSLPEGRARANCLSHIQVLHKALDLLDRPDREIWNNV
jgi:hypothetical protein